MKDNRHGLSSERMVKGMCFKHMFTSGGLDGTPTRPPLIQDRRLLCAVPSHKLLLAVCIRLMTVKLMRVSCLAEGSCFVHSRKCAITKLSISISGGCGCAGVGFEWVTQNELCLGFPSIAVPLTGLT